MSTRDLAFPPDDVGIAGPEITLEVSIVLLVVRRRREDLDVLADDLLGSVSEEALGRPIEPENGARGIYGDESIGGGIED